MFEHQSAEDETGARRRAMSLLARALPSGLAEPLAQRFADHGARDLKPVETGLVMLRRRAGGDGAPFNLGYGVCRRRRFPAASSNGSISRAASPAAISCSSSTSRPPLSTPITATPWSN
jgi:hypothetical protein